MLETVSCLSKVDCSTVMVFDRRLVDQRTFGERMDMDDARVDHR